MFCKPKRNEKWETIRKRELRNDIVLGIITVPMIYVWVVCMCVCGV